MPAIWVLSGFALRSKGINRAEHRQRAGQIEQPHAFKRHEKRAASEGIAAGTAVGRSDGCAPGASRPPPPHNRSPESSTRLV
jgi:hypothetical protein